MRFGMCFFDVAFAAERFVTVTFTEDNQAFLVAGAVRVLRQPAAPDADRVDLVDIFGGGQQGRDGPEGLAGIIHVEAGHDHPGAGVGQLVADHHQFVVEKLRLVDADHFEVVGIEENLRCRLHRCGMNHIFIMRYNVFGVKAGIDGRFEDLDGLFGDQSPAQTAEQFFGLTGEHRPADHFDPARPLMAM